jgi:hypothetical protein
MILTTNTYYFPRQHLLVFLKKVQCMLVDDRTGSLDIKWVNFSHERVNICVK